MKSTYQVSYYVNLLKGIENVLRSDYDVIGMTIFGSYARNEATTGSVLDLFVETVPANQFLMMDMKDFIKSILGVEVDIVRKHNGLNTYLNSQILKKGIHVIYPSRKHYISDH